MYGVWPARVPSAPPGRQMPLAAGPQTTPTSCTSRPRGQPGGHGGPPTPGGPPADSTHPGFQVRKRQTLATHPGTHSEQLAPSRGPQATPSPPPPPGISHKAALPFQGPQPSSSPEADQSGPPGSSVGQAGSREAICSSASLGGVRDTDTAQPWGDSLPTCEVWALGPVVGAPKSTGAPRLACAPVLASHTARPHPRAETGPWVRSGPLRESRAPLAGPGVVPRRPTRARTPQIARPQSAGHGRPGVSLWSCTVAAAPPPVLLEATQATPSPWLRPDS